jgi:hypothetical protein
MEEKEGEDGRPTSTGAAPDGSGGASEQYEFALCLSGGHFSFDTLLREQRKRETRPQITVNTMDGLEPHDVYPAEYAARRAAAAESTPMFTPYRFRKGIRAPKDFPLVQRIQDISRLGKVRPDTILCVQMQGIDPRVRAGRWRGVRGLW